MAGFRMYEGLEEAIAKKENETLSRTPKGAKGRGDGHTHKSASAAKGRPPSST